MKLLIKLESCIGTLHTWVGTIGKMNSLSTQVPTIPSVFSHAGIKIKDIIYSVKQFVRSFLDTDHKCNGYACIPFFDMVTVLSFIQSY